MTRKESDFLMEWTHLSGKVAERKDIIALIRGLSAKHFVEKNDSLAHTFRALEAQLTIDGQEDVKKLVEYINLPQTPEICANCKYLAKYAKTESGEKDCENEKIGQIINSVNYEEAEIFGCNQFEPKKELEK